MNEETSTPSGPSEEEKAARKARRAARAAAGGGEGKGKGKGGRKGGRRTAAAEGAVAAGKGRRGGGRQVGKGGGRGRGGAGKPAPEKIEMTSAERNETLSQLLAAASAEEHDKVKELGAKLVSSFPPVDEIPGLLSTLVSAGSSKAAIGLAKQLVQGLKEQVKAVAGEKKKATKD